MLLCEFLFVPRIAYMRYFWNILCNIRDVWIYVSCIISIDEVSSLQSKAFQNSFQYLEIIWKLNMSRSYISLPTSEPRVSLGVCLKKIK